MDKEKLVAMGIEEEAIDEILGEFDSMRQLYEEKLSDKDYEHETELVLIKSGAKKLKAVKALLEKGDVSVTEQVEQLKRNKDTRFLFEGERKVFEPYKSGEKLPDVKKDDYEALLQEARKRKDSVQAIKIKKMAAEEGIMLM